MQHRAHASRTLFDTERPGTNWISGWIFEVDKQPAPA